MGIGGQTGGAFDDHVSPGYRASESGLTPEQQKLAAHYERVYQKARASVRGETELVTPAMAIHWLSRNKGNRGLSAYTVLRYIRSVKLLEWVLNGEPVIVDTDDNLLDGQHRLEMVVRVGVPIPLYVIRGIAPSAFLTLNTGKTRSLADTIQILGESNARALASCLRLLHMHLTGTLGSYVGRTTKPSHNEMHALREKHPGLKDALKAILPLCQRGTHQPSVFAFLFYICDRKHPDRALEFFARVLTGAGLMEGTPEYLLSRMFSDQRRVRAWQTRAGRLELIALAIKAWNAFVTGSPMRLLRWNQGKDEFPSIL